MTVPSPAAEAVVAQSTDAVEFESLFIDDAIAEAGVWHDIGPFDMLVAFAAVSNKKYQQTLERLMKPHARAIDLGVFKQDADNDKWMEILHRAYAEAIVKNWRRIVENGKPKPYSIEECVRLFKRNPKVFSAVRKLADDDGSFRQKTAKVIAGNLPSASSTA